VPVGATVDRGTTKNGWKMLGKCGKIMEQPKSFWWKIGMENQTFRLFLGIWWSEKKVKAAKLLREETVR
jgi:hypothetical protein